MNRPSTCLATAIVVLVSLSPCDAQKRLPVRTIDLASIHQVVDTEAVFPVEDGKWVPAGRLVDFVVDGRNGELAFAAVRAGSKVLAVPARKIQWSKKTGKWTLSIDKKAFAALQSLPPKDLRTWGGRRIHYCYATSLAAAEVSTSRKKKVGSAIDFLIERTLPSGAFVTVRIGKNRCAVPLAALTLRTANVVNGRPSVVIDATVARMQGAPHLGSEKTTPLGDPAFRARLYAYFDVPQPLYEGLEKKNER